MNKHGALLMFVLGVSLILTACGPGGTNSTRPCRTPTSHPMPTPRLSERT